MLRRLASLSLSLLIGLAAASALLLWARRAQPASASALTNNSEAQGAVIIVNSLADTVADDGQCTLREAIVAANTDLPSGALLGECAAGQGDDVIDLTNLTGTVSLGSALPPITSNLTLSGPGADKLMIDGGGSVQVLQTTSGTVVIADLTIAHGYAGPEVGTGGGLFNSSPYTLTVLRTRFLENKAKGTDSPGDCGFGPLPCCFGGGGAIYHSQGTLNLVDSDVISNIVWGGNGVTAGYGAGGSGGGGAFGGGLFIADGVVNITATRFISNQVTGGNGGSRGPRGSTGCPGPFGGGQYQGLGGGGTGGSPSYGGGSGGGNGFFGGGGGGGGYGTGGGLGGFGGGAGEAFIFGVDDDGAGGGGGALGGGIFNRDGWLTVAESVFSGNQVVGGDGPEGAEDGRGIASTIFNSATLTLVNTFLPSPSLSNVTPARAAQHVSLNPTLSWQILNGGETLIYGYAPAALSVQVAFGASPADLVETTGVITSFTPPYPLALNTTYYWMITATTNYGVAASGLLSFTTTPAPAASFSAAPTWGLTPLTIAFTNTSSDADSFLWDFGDGGTSRDFSPSHTYPADGVYTVTLQAQGLGGSDSLTRTGYITVVQRAEAGFSGAPTVGLAPLAVTFTNASLAADTFLWDYGDGTTSATAALTHTHVYPGAGSYTISLTATGPYNQDTSTRMAYINVYDRPVASFNASPRTGIDSLWVTFNNHSLNATGYWWNFGDGFFSSAASPLHRYTRAGTYTVTLTAANPVQSDALIRPAYITVHPLPAPGFTAAPYLGLAPMNVVFTNTSLAADTFLWDYGDGLTSTVAALTHTHTYAAAGAYTVTLAAASVYGTRSLIEPYALAVFDPPSAAFTAAPLSGVVPLTVAFTNLSQNATEWGWNFGDGGTSPLISPTHSYTATGVFTVSLRARNPGGSDWLTQTNYITVNQGPVPAFGAAQRIGAAPLTVTLTNTSQFADGYVWDYGDGLTSTVAALAHTHVYSQPGVYTITLLAENIYGQAALAKFRYVDAFVPAAGAAHYVDAEGGSDTTGDGTQSAPWRTLTYALSQVGGASAEVRAASGVYDQALGESFPIVMKPGVSLIGSGYPDTVIAGRASAAVVLFSGASAYSTTTVLNGFEITGGLAGVQVDGMAGSDTSPLIQANWLAGNTYGLRVSTGRGHPHANPVIRGNAVFNNQQGIYLSVDWEGGQISPTVEANTITANAGSGVYCYAIGYYGDQGICWGTFQRNLIMQNGGDGLTCYTSWAAACNSVFTANVIAHNGGWGIKRIVVVMCLASSGLRFYNNFIFRNTGGGAEFDSCQDGSTFVNNTVADNGAYGIVGGPPILVNTIVWGQATDLDSPVDDVSYSDVGEGAYAGINQNISADPRFVDPAHDDYRLSLASPARNAGNNAAANLPATDFYGHPRIGQGQVDMGAAEFIPQAEVYLPFLVKPGK